jgi:hypothetical protein
MAHMGDDAGYILEEAHQCLQGFGWGICRVQAAWCMLEPDLEFRLTQSNGKAPGVQLPAEDDFEFGLMALSL